MITAIQASAGAMPWRSLIVVEEGAQVTVAEQYLSADEELEGYFNPVTEIVVGDGASVEYLCVQDLSERSWILGSQRAQVARDASLHWVGLGLGSGQGKLRMETDITGQRRERACDRRVRRPRLAAPRLRHDAGARRAPHDFRPRLPRDPARPRDGGLERHDQGRPRRQRTDAFQESRNLLLSDGAHADAIPASRSRPTTCAAPTRRRSRGSTRSRSSI